MELDLDSLSLRNHNRGFWHALYRILKEVQDRTVVKKKEKVV